MGNCLFNIIRRLQRNNNNKKSIFLLIVGLDNAGKTSVLNRIANDPDQTVMPTMGFRIVSLRHKSYCIKVYDVGGAPQIRSIWKKYYNDIHGLIYVVDASNISRLTENKIVFNELITHENIAGKPILLLANKQDLPEAIDELDLVEQLDVEHVANAMRCPTRVETCSCIAAQSRGPPLGVSEGYNWLLETISKNYSTLDHRIKASPMPPVNNYFSRKSSICMTSRSSTHSNPFKPIHELLTNHDERPSNHKDFLGSKTMSIKKFLVKNKTAPMPDAQIKSAKSQDDLTGSQAKFESFPPNGHNSQVTLVTLDPLNLYPDQPIINRITCARPFTAPASSFTNHSNEIFSVVNIPGQVS